MRSVFSIHLRHSSYRRVQEQLHLLKRKMKQELIVLGSPSRDEKVSANGPKMVPNVDLQKSTPNLTTVLHEGDLKCKDINGVFWKRAHVMILVGCVKYKTLFQTKYVVIPFENVTKICGTWTELHIVEDSRAHIFRACRSPEY